MVLLSDTIVEEICISAAGRMKMVCIASVHLAWPRNQEVSVETCMVEFRGVIQLCAQRFSVIYNFLSTCSIPKFILLLQVWVYSYNQLHAGSL